MQVDKTKIEKIENNEIYEQANKRADELAKFLKKQKESLFQTNKETEEI